MTNIWQWIKKYAGNIIVAVLFFCFLMVGLTFNKDQETFKKQDQIKEYVLKDGTQVASSKIKEISQSDLKKIVKQSDKKTKEVAKKFSKVDGITTAVNEIRIDTIQVKPIDSVKFDFNYGGEFVNKEYKFNYQVNQHGFILTDFVMIDTTITVDGKKRSWILGKQSENSDTFHTNKNIKTQAVEKLKTKPKRPWYWSTTAKIVYAGLFVGAGVSAIP